MTIIETQTLLTTIDGHLEGKSGEIYGVSISNGVAVVNIDWAAFKSNFSGTTADQKGHLWSKTVGDITYTSKQNDNSVISSTVPA